MDEGSIFFERVIYLYRYYLGKNWISDWYAVFPFLLIEVRWVPVFQEKRNYFGHFNDCLIFNLSDMALLYVAKGVFEEF